MATEEDSEGNPYRKAAILLYLMLVILSFAIVDDSDDDVDILPDTPAPPAIVRMA